MNSLNSVSKVPRSMSGWERLRRMLRIACVAQALLITCHQPHHNMCHNIANTDLSGKEDLLQSAVPDDGALRLLPRTPFVQEYQAMDRSRRHTVTLQTSWRNGLTGASGMTPGPNSTVPPLVNLAHLHAALAPGTHSLTPTHQNL